MNRFFPTAIGMIVFSILSMQGLAMPEMKWNDLMVIKSAAVNGDPQSQFLFGVQLMVGDGIWRDRVEAVKWLNKAAESGLAEAQVYLGKFYADPSPENEFADLRESEKWLQAAARQGDQEAQVLLGVMSSRGPLRNRAITAADDGNPKSADPKQPNAGVSSREMNEDPAETVRWSLLLSGLRGADAFLIRGVMLENGVAVNRDLPAAARSYRMAADLGSALAQYHLGLMYAEGRGTAQNLAEASVWLERAVSNGSIEALAELAKIKTNDQMGNGGQIGP